MTLLCLRNTVLSHRVQKRIFGSVSYISQNVDQYQIVLYKAIIYHM